MKKILLTVLTALVTFVVQAQVTTSPAILTEDATDIVIYYHADQGNKGLINQPADQPIYAHTGVITNKSASGSDWKYAPTWGDNSDKYKLTYVSENLWKLEMGDIRQYYGITDSSVVVEKLAFVFRNANNSKEGKTAENGDIYVDVHKAGTLEVSLTSSLSGNVFSEVTEATFTANATQNADIVLTINDETFKTDSPSTSLSVNYTFSQPGTYKVTATATAGDLQASAEETYVFLGEAVKADYPGGVPQMGAKRQANGDVIFCLAAPGKQNVSIVGSWSNYDVLAENAMAYQDYNGQRYFWITIKGLDATSMYPYYYIVDGTMKVGDPYAKLVLDPANDKYIPKSVYPNLPEYPAEKVGSVQLAVYQENINDYNWTVKNFKGAKASDLVIYELLFRDFTGTEGKSLGDGTVRLAMEKIPYLKRLGVNAVELLPINEFNGNISWGYNPNFYFAPDKAYGTPDDYKAFIDECHRNGIAVILDVVFNQTDWQHPWYRMYPVGQNPFYNADAPHAYSVLNDWNQGNPLVRQQFKDVLKYWVEEYKVDGYRFDLVKGLGDNSSYTNNGDAATNAYNASRVANMRDLQLALQEVKADAYFINENLAGNREENEMAAYGQLNWANVNTEGRQYAMGYKDNSSLNRFYAPYDQRNWGSTVSYLESHDEERLAYAQNQYGAVGIKGNLTNSMRRLGSAAAQMLLAPGAHMIWQFSELGNDQTTKNSNGGNNTDPKKVLWSYYDEPQRRALYDEYSALIHLRTANPELFAENITFSMQCLASNWADGRVIYNSTDSKELVTVINPTVNQTITMKVNLRSNQDSDYQILSKSADTNPAFSASNGSVTVPANSYVVIGSKGVTGVETLEAASESEIVAIYDVNGMRRNELQQGVNIVVRADGSRSKIFKAQ